MANPQHVEVVRGGKEDIEDWLRKNPGQTMDLEAAALAFQDLHGADLRGANLHGADLHGAGLHRADLRGANLHGADLHGADLHGADLREANLSDADLQGANLQGANLSSTDLTGATFPQEVFEFLLLPQRVAIRFSQNTRFPEDLDVQRLVKVGRLVLDESSESAAADPPKDTSLPPDRDESLVTAPGPKRAPRLRDFVPDLVPAPRLKLYFTENVSLRRRLRLAMILSAIYEKEMGEPLVLDSTEEREPAMELAET